MTWRRPTLCAKYREACQRMHQLENDIHWDHTLAEAVHTAPPNQIRTLFAIIISTCYPSNARELWNKYKEHMTNDILNRTRRTTSNYELETNEEMLNESLILIEDMCLLMCGNPISKLGMPAPNHPMHDAFNQEIHREQNFDRNAMNDTVQENVPKLSEYFFKLNFMNCFPFSFPKSLLKFIAMKTNNNRLIWRIF